MVGSQCVGQNLIERTKLGLSSQSTLEPNQLSKEVKKLKSSRTVELFSWDDRKSTNPSYEVNLTLSRKQLNTIALDSNASLNIKIPVSKTHSFRVDLKPFKVQSEEGQLLTPEGSVASKNKMQFYRGVIDGDHGSLVTASIINGDLQMSISDQDGVYRISPSNYNSDNYYIWIDNALQEREFTCGTDDTYRLERKPELNITPTKDNNQKGTGDVVQVYVECDNRLRSNKGGVNGAEAFVAQLFAEIITLYANENINIEVSDIFVWTSQDPYAGNEDRGIVLNQFSNNTQDNYNGRLATLLKGNTNNSCSVGGLANVDVLCQSYSVDFFGKPFGPYSVNHGIGYCSEIGFDALEVSVVAHELGHNIASPHTHACAWGPNNNQKIDNCGNEGSCSLVTSPTPSSESNTIMSYCRPTNFTNGFGTEPGNLMRGRVAAATCLSSSGGSNGQDPCTHETLTYNGGFVFSTEVKANDRIELKDNVTVLGNANVNWQAENQFEVFGTLTIPAGAKVNVIAEDCN